MQKLMNKEQIIKFIKRMPYNRAYAAIASDYNANAVEAGVEIEGEGWWSILKLKYADAETLLFDYFGGGYPVAYSIDGLNGEDTIKNAVEDFLAEIIEPQIPCQLYVVDTTLEYIEFNTK